MNQALKVGNKIKLYYLLSALSLLLLQKIIFLFVAAPLPDEAYYWLWAKNIDLSYFDHPPLSIWFQSLLGIIITDKNLLIRAVPITCFILFMVIVYFWTESVVTSFSLNIYLQSLVLALSLPILSIFLTISFPDCVVILCLSLSGFFFSSFLRFSKKQVSRITFWYLSVFFFSLAMLTKYNSVLFGLGILIFLIFYSKQKTIIFSRHLIIAIILIAIIQIPVIGWNITNEFLSFRFHLKDRLEFSIHLDQVLKQILVFFFGFIISFSPFFFLNTLSPRKTLSLNSLEDEQKKVASSIFISTLIFCCFLSIFITVQYYWALPAIIAFIPILQNILNTAGRFVGLFIFGIFLNTILIINYGVTPVSGLWGPVDRETGIIFGWKQITKEISTLKEKNNIRNVLFSDYRVGSLYAFHSGDINIDVFMKDRDTQFDYWRKKRLDKAPSFNKALIVVDNKFPINSKIEKHFKDIQLIKNIEIKKGSVAIKSYNLYVANN